MSISPSVDACVPHTFYYPAVKHAPGGYAEYRLHEASGVSLMSRVARELQGRLNRSIIIPLEQWHL